MTTDIRKSAIFAFQLTKLILQTNRTSDIISDFRDVVLVCKMHDCYCTIRKYFEHFHSFSSGFLIQRCKRLRWLTRLYENKSLQNVFKRIQDYIYLFKLYSIRIILLLKNNLTNICSKISKIGQARIQRFKEVSQTDQVPGFPLAAAWISRSTSVIICIELSTLIH